MYRTGIAQQLRLSPALAGWALVLITVVAYGPALDGGFVFDDHLYVTGDDRMATGGGLLDIWTQVSGEDYRRDAF